MWILTLLCGDGVCRSVSLVVHQIVWDTEPLFSSHLPPRPKLHLWKSLLKKEGAWLLQPSTPDPAPGPAPGLRPPPCWVDHGLPGSQKPWVCRLVDTFSGPSASLLWEDLRFSQEEERVLRGSNRGTMQVKDGFPSSLAFPPQPAPPDESTSPALHRGRCIFESFLGNSRAEGRGSTEASRGH